MQKNKRKILTRIFCAIVCSVIICTSSLCFRSDAAGVFPEDSPVSAWQPLFTGKVWMEFLNDVDTIDSVAWFELPEVLAGAAGVEDDPHTYTFLDSVYPAGVGRNVDMTYTGEIGYYSDWTIGGRTYQTWELGYNFKNSHDTVKSVRYELDPIYCSGSAVSKVLKSLLCVGDGTWETDVRIEYITGQHYYFSYNKTFTRSIGANSTANQNYNYATALTASQIEDVQYAQGLNYPNTSACIRLIINWTPERELYYQRVHLVMPVFRRSNPTYPVTTVGDSNESITPADWYLWDLDVKQTVNYWKTFNGSTIQDFNFVEWAGQAVGSVFDLELFSDVSIGDISLMVLAVGVVFWLLKLFAGG